MFKKVYLFSLVVVLVTIMFLYFDNYTKNIISAHERILRIIKTIEGLETKVDSEVFRAGLILYHSYDSLNRYMNELDRHIEMLLNDKYLQKDEYRDVLNMVVNYKKMWEKKKEYIEDFKTANSPIKNTAMYLPLLTLRYIQSIKTIKDLRYTYLLTKIVSSIYLSRNSFDLDFVYDIEKDINNIKNHNLT